MTDEELLYLECPYCGSYNTEVYLYKTKYQYGGCANCKELFSIIIGDGPAFLQ